MFLELLSQSYGLTMQETWEYCTNFMNIVRKSRIMRPERKNDSIGISREPARHDAYRLMNLRANVPSDESTRSM